MTLLDNLLPSADIGQRTNHSPIIQSFESLASLALSIYRHSVYGVMTFL